MDELFKKLVFTHSVTGDTRRITDLIKQELTSAKVDFVEDGYGSVIAGFSETKKPKVMFAAHVDEVGFQISKINPDGSLSLLPVGWVFPNRLDHTAVYIQTADKEVNGVVFHKAPLKSENIDKFSDLFCDIGATSAEEVAKMGVKIGQTGTYKKDYFEQNDTVFASSIDNNVSVFALLKLIKEDKHFLDDTFVVFHTDEEMQDHAGNSIGFQYAPEYAVVMDYCPSNPQWDADDVMPNDQGALIMYRGGAHIIHEDLRAKFDKLNIAKGFISANTLPSLEPQNFQNNGQTKAVNLCIPAHGYHGQMYAMKFKDLESFIDAAKQVRAALLA